MKGHMKLILDARDLFYENDWCKRTYAKNHDGEPSNVMDNDTCSFCITGAIYRAVGKNPDWHPTMGEKLTRAEEINLKRAFIAIYDELVMQNHIVPEGYRKNIFDEITNWNDNKCIDKIEMTNVLDDVIGRWEAQQNV